MAIQSESAEKSTLVPGTMVGEYRITHKLGEGGMGVVYAGMHPEIGKRVAIKVLAPHAAVYPDLIRRFKEEARAVNKIRNPNIIDIFAFNQLSDGRHYFVMEYLEGENLAARLERGPMKFAEMRRLLAQICSALEAAHDAGVVHRDLKPDNVWIATQHLSEPRIKLLDFGIAKLNDLTGAKATLAGTALGTPHYMPPEQGMGRAVDQRADIYALGVILYQLFTGRLPFNGTTAQEIIFKHVTDAPIPPSRYHPIGAETEKIILDCLEKEPARRPASVRELGARLEAAFASERPDSVHMDVSPAIPRVDAPRPASGASQRTEILPETSPRAPGPATAVPTSTTLRNSSGELATRPSEEYATDAPELLGRRAWWRRPGVLVVVGAAVAAAIVVAVGVGGHRQSDVAVSPAQPASVALSAVATAPSTEKAAAPAPVETPPVVAVPVAAPTPEETPSAAASMKVAHQAPTHEAHDGSRPDAAKPDHARKSSHTKKPATSEHPTPSVKSNCNPNFTLDAQGEKHFKPECF